MVIATSPRTPQACAARRSLFVLPVLACVLLAGAVPAAHAVIDIRIQSVAYSVPLPGPIVNETVPILVTVVNDGNETAGPFQVAIWKNRVAAPTDAATADDAKMVTSLAPGADNAVTLQFDVIYPVPGTYTFWAWADSQANHAEASEDNNLYAIFLPVTQALSDVIIESIIPDNTAPVAGAAFNVAVTIRNQGRVATGIFRVGLWKNRATAPTTGGGYDDNIRVSALPAGQSQVLNFSVVYDAQGTYTLWILVDANGDAAEVNEDNNAAGVELTVAPPSNGGGGGGGCLGRGTTPDVLPIFGMAAMLGIVTTRRLTRTRYE